MEEYVQVLFLQLWGPQDLEKILTGRVKASTGSIYINGVLAQTDDLKTLVGYVPQKDVVLPELTVRENIIHSARVRLGRRLNGQEIQKFVDTLIHSLGLYKVRDCYVGVANRGLSGGERKRVNIALELAATPQVLLLDEPTSGLDARAALSLIELLKSLSEQGITICCVVHQPRTEIFLALDYLLLLSGGRQVYFGQAGDVIPYLERLGHIFSDNFNPADKILDVITGLENSSCQEDDVLLEEDQGSQKLTTLLYSVRSQRAPWYVQVYLKFLRGTKQQSRQVASFSLEIASGAITGLLIGLSNYEFKGHLFQGLFKQPFEALSSAVSYRLLTEQGMLNCLAIGTKALS
ncbi:ABC transporter [Penicillium taxi]|uniref:ABC transporter n=1 Tax=Penicillium taxi TaxID=168475 RepID=UPI0025451AD8|nr:ABC transporter [Penicillium taxi]KAJ5893910.1 ABC transporter [Penicillium taxi]